MANLMQESRPLQAGLLDDLTEKLLQLYPNLGKFNRNEIDSRLHMMLDSEMNLYNELKLWYVDANKSLVNNIYQFTAAKTYSIMSDLKVIDTEELEDNIAKLARSEFSKFQTEVDLVGKNSTYANTLYETENGEKYLMLITQEDSKVRDWHKKYNRTTLPATDSFWTTTALKILGSWNDRCQVIEAIDVTTKQLDASRRKVKKNKDDKNLQKIEKDVNEKNGNEVIINIEDDRVVTFWENSLIDEMPDVMRRKYSKKYE